MSKVFFTTVNSPSDWSQSAKKLLVTLTKDNQTKFEKTVPIKIHTGEPGNISYIQPKYFNGIIDLLESRGSQAIFMETNTASGPRSNGAAHRQIAKDHGFTRIPFEVADGEEGFDQVLVPIKTGKHFAECKIAAGLHKYNQVIIASH